MSWIEGRDNQRLLFIFDCPAASIKLPYSYVVRHSAARCSNTERTTGTAENAFGHPA
jgi:hypothetical protein